MNKVRPDQARLGIVISPKMKSDFELILKKKYKGMTKSRFIYLAIEKTINENKHLLNDISEEDAIEKLMNIL